MTTKEVVEQLQYESCYECSWGTESSMIDCTNTNCKLRQAVLEVLLALYNSGVEVEELNNN